MKTVLLAAAGLALAAAPAAAQNWHGGHGYGQSRHHDRDDHRGPDAGNGHGYDWNRPDRRHGDHYDPARYYHGDNRGYRVTRLGRNDRVYRGSDNRYYCRRSDGTTGLIVGGVAGGLLGNLLTSGGSQTLGTLLGAGGGALLGRSVDRGNVTCR